MGSVKESLKRKSSSNSEEAGNFHYAAVPGKEDVIQITFVEEGKKRSVLLETFSDEQFELFDRLREKINLIRFKSEDESLVFND